MTLYVTQSWLSQGAPVKVTKDWVKVIKGCGHTHKGPPPPMATITAEVGVAAVPPWSNGSLAPPEPWQHIVFSGGMRQLPLRLWQLLLLFVLQAGCRLRQTFQALLHIYIGYVFF